MKMLKIVGIKYILIFFILTFLVSCISKESNFIYVEGYILSFEKDRILIAENISLEKYNKIADKTAEELDINNKDHVSLIYLGYEDIEGLNKGDKIKAKISNNIDQSFPAQAVAEHISVIN